MRWGAIGLALACAVVNAMSNVVQREANRAEPPELALRPRLILNLLHRPLWLAGFGAVIVSFLLQVVALRLGTLAGVQPVIILELPLTLVGAARLLGARVGRREWLATLGATVGVAAFLAALDPNGGSPGTVSWVRWTAAGASTVLLIALVTVTGVVAKGGRRAALLGLATGMTFGLTAALTKGTTDHFSQGVVGVATAWQTYAMVVTGLAGMFLLQNALHAGSLVASQPGTTLADPSVAVLWGVLVFHESTRDGFALVVAVLAALVVGVSTVVLSRSPLLHDEQPPAPVPGRRRRPPTRAVDRPPAVGAPWFLPGTDGYVEADVENMAVAKGGTWPNDDVRS